MQTEFIETPRKSALEEEEERNKEEEKEEDEEVEGGDEKLKMKEVKVKKVKLLHHVYVLNCRYLLMYYIVLCETGNGQYT